MKFIAMVAGLLVAGVVNAATWYVGTNGNDKAAGTNGWASAKQTIMAAMVESREGDTIIVTNGTYPPIRGYNKPITIQSVNGAEVTIIDGGGSNYLNNCIVWDNDDNHGVLNDWESFSTNYLFTHSSTLPVPAGEGNSGADPLFVDAANGGFRHPCSDTDGVVESISRVAGGDGVRRPCETAGRERGEGLAKTPVGE